MIICTFMLIHTLGGKQRPFDKNIIYYSNMSGKRSKILEKSGKNQEFHQEEKVGTLCTVIFFVHLLLCGKPIWGGDSSWRWWGHLTTMWHN